MVAIVDVDAVPRICCETAAHGLRGMGLAGTSDGIALAFNGQQHDRAQRSGLNPLAVNVPRPVCQACSLEHDVDHIEEVLGWHVEKRQVFAQRPAGGCECVGVAARHGSSIAIDQRHVALWVGDRDLGTLQIGRKYLTPASGEAVWHRVDQRGTTPVERMRAGRGSERTRMDAGIEGAADQR